MAKALIDSLTSDFDADSYRDEYREELLALIERKAKGESIVADQSEAPKPTKAPDLMAALEESLAAVKGEEASRSRSPSRSPSPRPRRARRRRPIAKQGQSRQVEVDGRELALTNLDKVLWPRGRLHQGRGDRLLRADRADDPAPPARPRADPGPVSRRRRGPALLREARAEAHARLGQDRADRDGLGRGARLHRLRRPPDPGLARAARGARAAPLARRSPKSPSARPCSPSTSIPGAPATAVECAQVALRLRELFDELGLECFAKHSGSKGIQVYVPLNTAVTYEQTKPYARAVAQALEKSEPELVVSQAERRSCARARSSSTGARTTTRRRRSPSTRCAAASGRGRRRR